MNTYRDNLMHSYAADFYAWLVAGQVSPEPTVPPTLTYQEASEIRIGAYVQILPDIAEDGE